MYIFYKCNSRRYNKGVLPISAYLFPSTWIALRNVGCDRPLVSSISGSIATLLPSSYNTRRNSSRGNDDRLQPLLSRMLLLLVFLFILIFLSLFLLLLFFFFLFPLFFLFLLLFILLLHHPHFLWESIRDRVYTTVLSNSHCPLRFPLAPPPLSSVDLELHEKL